MTVCVSWTIQCDAWLEDGNDGCEVQCHAGHDGDSFTPNDDGWINVEYGNAEDEGEHYCPACAKRKGVVDVNG